ncbi:unnamed protein product [Cylindrotheca closterium]|uniref:Uncharacterized protein n=1 Tax=Cylindrotheca closterium TaxID=2856 RepID=A0AAD2JJV6_9STRA|nr:unnamed protein product [Cylindrotheca closterium]
MMKISGGIFKNPLRNNRKSEANTSDKQAKATQETLEPTLSEDEDDELSIASFSLRPCTNSTRGNTNRGNIPLNVDDDESSSDSFLNDDPVATKEQSRSSSSERKEEFPKTTVFQYIRRMEKVESSRTFRTVATVEEDAEAEDDEIHASDHYRASFRDFEKEAPTIGPNKSNTSSLSKSPKSRKLKTTKKLETNGFPLDSPGKLKKKKKKNISKKANKDAISNGASFSVNLPESFRDLDEESNRKVKTKSKKKTRKSQNSVDSKSQPKRRSSVESNNKPKRHSSVGSKTQPKRQSSISSVQSKTQPKRQSNIGSTIQPKRFSSVPKRKSSIGSKTLPKRQSSVGSKSMSSDQLSISYIPCSSSGSRDSESQSQEVRISMTEAHDSNNASVSSSSHTRDSQEPKKRISFPSDEAPDSNNASVPSSNPTTESQEPKKSILVPSDEACDMNTPSNSPSASSGNDMAESHGTSQQPSTAIDPPEANALHYSLDLQNPTTTPDAPNEPEHEEDNMLREIIPSPTLAERRKRKQATLDKLVNKFNSYESKLEEERMELSNHSRSLHFKQDPTDRLLEEEIQQKVELQKMLQEETKQKEEFQRLLKEETKQKEEFEQLLKEETKQKAELQSQLQAQLDNANVEGRELEELKEKILKLEERNDHLQQENAQHEESIYSLRLAEKDMKRKLLLGAKSQGELLLLRSTLNSKTAMIEDLSKELARAKQELDDALNQDTKVSPLQKQIETLEANKRNFAAEVERLTKELKRTKQELQAATETSITDVPAAASSWLQTRSSLSSNNLQEVPEQSNTGPRTLAELEEILEPTSKSAKEGSWLSKSFRRTVESPRPSISNTKQETVSSWWPISRKMVGEQTPAVPSGDKTNENGSNNRDTDLLDFFDKSDHPEFTEKSDPTWY